MPPPPRPDGNSAAAGCNSTSAAARSCCCLPRSSSWRVSSSTARCAYLVARPSRPGMDNHHEARFTRPAGRRNRTSALRYFAQSTPPGGTCANIPALHDEQANSMNTPSLHPPALPESGSSPPCPWQASCYMGCHGQGGGSLSQVDATHTNKGWQCGSGERG